jgi:hypothetical protein
LTRILLWIIPKAVVVNGKEIRRQDWFSPNKFHSRPYRVKLWQSQNRIKFWRFVREVIKIMLKRFEP